MEAKSQRWIRCPIQLKWVYVEDCEDCEFLLSKYTNISGLIVIRCAFQEAYIRGE